MVDGNITTLSEALRRLKAIIDHYLQVRNDRAQVHKVQPGSVGFAYHFLDGTVAIALGMRSILRRFSVMLEDWRTFDAMFIARPEMLKMPLIRKNSFFDQYGFGVLGNNPG